MPAQTGHKLKMEILKKIYRESSAYFKNQAIQKQRSANIVSLNEWYRREEARQNNK